jgi:PAS domain S-box-containing protein
VPAAVSIDSSGTLKDDPSARSMPAPSTADAGARRAIAVARTAALVAVAGGVLGLAAWMFGIRFLMQPIPGVASMKPNTAIGIVCAGLSLWFLTHGRLAHVVRGLAVFVSLLGLVTLSQDVFGWNAGIDELLFVDTNRVATPAPGRMAPMTAVSFALLGLGLAASSALGSVWVAQGAATVVLATASIAVFGYMYDINALYGVSAYTSMAVHTAILLAVLAAGLLALRPTAGIAAVLISRELEGTAVRRFLVAGIVVPVFLGWLPQFGERWGWYDFQFGVALAVVGTVILLSIVVFANTHSLRRLRIQSEAALRDANEQLQFKVERRTKELAHREQEFRLVVEEAHEAFVAMDARGRIVNANAAAEEVFGWPRAELIGRLVSDTLMPERYRDPHRQGLNRFLSGGESRVLDRLIQIEALHRDGHEFPVVITIAAVWFDDEWRFNAFIRDLSALRETESHLKAALEDKEALLREVHHRVKNNLQVVSSFLRLQAGSLTDRAAIAALRQSEERVMSLALVHENLYRSDNLGRVVFDRYLDALTAELLRAYPATGGRLTVSTESELPALDIETAVPLGLLVNELVTNALKHAFPDGRRGHVSVRLSGDGTRATLTVNDDGSDFRPARPEARQRVWPSSTR